MTAMTSGRSLPVAGDPVRPALAIGPAPVEGYPGLRLFSFHTTLSGHKDYQAFFFHGLLVVDAEGGEWLFNWSARRMGFEEVPRPDGTIESPRGACAPGGGRGRGRRQGCTTDEAGSPVPRSGAGRHPCPTRAGIRRRHRDRLAAFVPARHPSADETETTMATLLKLAEDYYAANTAACDEIVARLKSTGCEDSALDELIAEGAENDGRSEDEASDVNNAGPALQVASLIEGNGPEAAERLIEGVIAEQAPRP